MERDGSWKSFWDDPERYADAINGFGCGGEQIVKAEDLQDVDTQIHGIRRSRFVNSFGEKSIRTKKFRDVVRRVAFGVNFMIIGIESQETVDYSLPLRNMIYDVAEYEKQAKRIRKKVRKNGRGLRPGEYLYGFRKDSKLNPVMTFVLYNGDEWDGPTCLHDILDFTDIPVMLRRKIPNYPINIINIRKIEDTSIFKTDLRYVLEFLRNTEDKEKLRELVENTPYYQNMDEDAYDVVATYADINDLTKVKAFSMNEGGKINMCTAIREMLEDSKMEGRMEGVRCMINTARKYHVSDDEIIKQLVEELKITEKEAKEYLQLV